MGTCRDILDTIYYLIVDMIPVIVKPTTYSNNTRVCIYALSTMHYFLVVEVFYSVQVQKHVKLYDLYHVFVACIDQ